VTLSATHRRFLLVDQVVGSIVVNFVLNAAIAWTAFRSASVVPLWGQSSIAADTLGTAFVLPVLTSLIAGRLVHHEVVRGRVPPLTDVVPSAWVRRSSLQRGAAVGVLAVVLVAVPTVLVFALAGPAELARWPFIWFKATFAAALGAVVTPVLAWWALARASQAPPALPSRSAGGAA
jgi:hypothetical protein